MEFSLYGLRLNFFLLVCCRIFADLIIADQKEFASKYYGTIPKNIKSWLRCATDLRNICAHSGRLYFRIFSAIPANIQEVESKDARSLWASFLAVRNLYPDVDKWNNEILPLIQGLFKKYENSIQLCHISFLEDWLNKGIKNNPLFKPQRFNRVKPACLAGGVPAEEYACGKAHAKAHDDACDRDAHGPVHCNLYSF